ncbi:MAG: Rpn family recombination-promoting nuclease/putative transposase [Bacteroidota bacterium]|uniref:Rpn family recombination-promoting nuclease/putative transposase n=1 Tax=Runella sp. TaxID=1960881 RepID=UPI003018ED6B
MPNRKKPRRKDHEPHDAVFKAFFSDAIIAQNYLLHYTEEAIHSRIDFTVFRKVDTAFVSGRFGISFSDVLYETRLTTGAPARLLFLFEHKSYVPSIPIHLQLLDYLLQIWEDDIKNGRRLSFVIPIVVFHGVRSWKQKAFSGYFSGLPKNWEVFIPNFHYWLTNLNKIPPQEIEEKVETEYLKNLFLALKFARNEQFSLKDWPNILTFGKPFYLNNREGILLQTLTLYVFNLYNMTETQAKELNKQLPEAERDWIDAIPEIFGRKWKEEGIKEGKKEGKKEGIREGMEKTTLAVTIKTIQKFPDWSDAEVSEFVGATEQFVRQVRNELGKKK